MLRRSLIAVTACATLLCANSAGAQERQIGVTVGASLASVTRESGPAGEDPYDGRTGFAAGAFFHLPVRDRPDEERERDERHDEAQRQQQPHR